MFQNSIVRIEVTSIDINWIQPYKTPNYSKNTGSGSFIDTKGHILTCSHVIEDASSIYISIGIDFSKKYKATVVSCCPTQDIALIKIDPTQVIGGISPIVIGDSNKLKITDKIWAIGFPLSQHMPSITQGIISSFQGNRIHMDAVINGGNSGGPLLNSKKQLIGIIDSVLASTRLGNSPISRAIPCNVFKYIKHIMLKGTDKIIYTPNLGIVCETNSGKVLQNYLNYSNNKYSTDKKEETSKNAGKKNVGKKNVGKKNVGKKNVGKKIGSKKNAGKKNAGKKIGSKKIGSKKNSAKKTAVKKDTVNKTSQFNGAVVQYIYPSSMLATGNHIIKKRDIITKLNNFTVDAAGMCTVGNFKMTLSEIMSYISWESKLNINLAKTPKALSINIGKNRPFFGIRTRYPLLENICYITCLGLVLMELTHNHIKILPTHWGKAQTLQLEQYRILDNCIESVLVIVDILPESPASFIDSLTAGDIIAMVNDIPITTMKSFVKAVADKYKSNETNILIESKFHDYFSFPLTKDAFAHELTLNATFGIAKDASIFSKIAEENVIIS
jgi:S1-C subfamily serine protease